MKEKILRKLAKSYRYQVLYGRAKESGMLSLFRNSIDLSGIQLLFLNWLEIYNSLYNDLASKEEFLTEEVIGDDLRTEAYLLFRSEKRKTTSKKLSSKGEKITPHNIPTVIFSKKEM